MAGSTLPPVSAATAGVLKRLGEEMAEAGDPQLASHLRIGQVTAIDTGTITATVAYGAGANLVAIAGHHWLDGHEPAVNDYVEVLSQDGDNWIVGKIATAMTADISWINVSGGVGFQHAWVNIGGAFQVAQYRKVSDAVEIRGHVKDGAFGATGVGDIFTLPSGYRPPAEMIWMVWGNDEQPARLDVDPNGHVIARDTGGSLTITQLAINVRFSTI